MSAMVIASNSQRITIAVDVPITNPGEVKPRKQRINNSWRASFNYKTGPFATALLVDIQLRPCTIANRGTYDNEFALFNWGSCK